MAMGPRLTALVRTALAAALVACVAAASAQQPPNPYRSQMLAAAGVMQAASKLLYAEKERLGLLPPAATDPNKTGMIGLEYTPMTTTPGELPAKRTTTSPDFAAAMVKMLAGQKIAAGAPVVVVLSGSYVGGDVAMLAALEVLQLKPILIISAGTSQFGANDPEFNIIDMLKLLRERGVISTKGVIAVLGGTDGAGGGQDAPSRASLHASAAADGIPVIDTQPLAAMVDELVAKARAELRGTEPGAVINVGAGIVGPGTCDESFTFPPGVTTTPVPCTAGTAGILMKMAGPGLPVVHIINMMRLSAELGFAYDPVPFPAPGANGALYGPAPAAPFSAAP